MSNSSSLLFALFLAVYVGFLGYGMMLLHLGAESHAVAQKKIPASLPDLIRLPRIRTDLRFAARNCALLVLPLAVIVFLLMPRTRTAAFITSFNVGPYQTGFNDNGVQFHEEGQLTPSDAIALRVKMYRGGTVYCPDVSDLYIRGLVLTEFSPRTITPRGPREAHWLPEMESSDTQASKTQPSKVEPPLYSQFGEEDVTTEVYTIEMPASHTRFVQAPILKPDEANFIYSLQDITLRDNSNFTENREYTIRSLPRQEWPQWEFGEPSVTPGLLRFAKDNSPAVWVSPQITALARELAAEYLPPEGQPVPTDSIRMVMSLYETYLRTHYPYSLTFHQVDLNLDPTTDFLLNRKTTGGHCEDFASAMVMLCRAVGLNARLVTGFHGGEFNVVDSSFTLRQKDAHAWAEVYVPDQGWVLSDPSPIQSNVGATGDYSVVRWARDFGQMLQNYWLSLVVMFDNDARRALWVQIGILLQKVGGYLHDLVTISDASDLLLRLAIFGPMLGLAILGAWSIRRWRADRRKLRDARGSPWRAMVALSGGIWFLDELFSLLERHGAARRMDQTPREYLEAFIGRLGEASPEARWLIALGYEVRFGELELDSSLRGKVNASLKHVRMSLSGKSSPH